MIVISASREEADISGTASALEEIGLTIRSLVASSGASVTFAAAAHNPAPYDHWLSRLVVSKGLGARVTVQGNDLSISGSSERLEELASCFLFPADAQDGQHFHFEPLPSDPDYLAESLGLVVTVSRSGPNNSFKPSPLRGLVFAVSCTATLGRYAGRLNSGVMFYCHGIA